jgi:hypothetical protein
MRPIAGVAPTTAKTYREKISRMSTLLDCSVFVLMIAERVVRREGAPSRRDITTRNPFHFNSYEDLPNGFIFRMIFGKKSPLRPHHSCFRIWSDPYSRASRDQAARGRARCGPN